MAHAAHISKLTSDLIRSLVRNPDGHLDQFRDNAIRTLRNASHSRTNQFEVQSRLSGLVEKFVVLNREDLGEVLQNRLDLLPKEYKWLPEILSFLLALSDRPLEKTELADIDGLSKDSSDENGGLSWQDIVADDPLDNADGLWDDVDRGYHSSGDEEVPDAEAESDRTTSTLATSITEDEVTALARLQVFSPDSDALHGVETFHQHLKDDLYSDPISELTLIRETLLMLHGLATNVYDLSDSRTPVSARTDIRLATLTNDTLHQSMLSFADIGSSLNNLRLWARRQHHVMYLQSCQAAIQTTLTEFGCQLANIEQRYISAEEDTVVSLMDVRREVEDLSRPTVRLARITDAAAMGNDDIFAFLDCLYDSICISELSGDAEVYQTLIPIFLAGLKTFLRPVSEWITHGTCENADGTSLVVDRDPKCYAGNFWLERYSMREFPGGRPYAPRCFETFALKAFALGKSRAFLSFVNGVGNDDYGGLISPKPDFSALERFSGQRTLLPFTQTLEDALDLWLKDSTQDSMVALRHALMHDHGLAGALDSLSGVFCSRDGTAFQAFADDVFLSVDGDTGTCSNDFLLTELAQATIGAAALTNTPIVRIDKHSGFTGKSSSIQRLNRIVLEVKFPWQLQNITHAQTPNTYSKTFSLLLQVYRAKSLLGHRLFDLRLRAVDQARALSVLSVALRLRMHLMTAVDIFYDHITTVAATLNNSLCHDIALAEDVDAMAEVWAKHDKHLETSLLLAGRLKPMREALTSYLELCEQYHELWKEVKHIADAALEHQDLTALNKQSEHLLSRARALQAEASKSLSFIIAGLRGIGRAGGNTSFETLAERLEWIVY